VAIKHITKMYDRLDKIAEAYYGSTENGEVEDLILPANPGLEKHGILLPPGIEVILPEKPKAESKPVIRMITLFD